MVRYYGLYQAGIIYEQAFCHPLPNFGATPIKYKKNYHENTII